MKASKTYYNTKVLACKKQDHIYKGIRGSALYP